MRRDQDRDQERPIEYINGQLVVFRRAEVKRVEVGEDDDDAEDANVDEKRLRSEKDEGENPRKRFAVEIPAPRKVLSRGEPMDVDGDEDMGASASKGKQKEAPEVNKRPAKAKAQSHLWEKLRAEADVSKISQKILEGTGTVPNLTLKDILAISPDLISEWFGVKRVPVLGGGPGIKEKDLREQFLLDGVKEPTSLFMPAHHLRPKGELRG